MSKWLIQEIRTKFSECDCWKIVYNAKYFIWFEEARFEIAKRSGLNQYCENHLEEELITFPVITAECKYLKPISYDVDIIVKTKLQRPKTAKLVFEHVVADKLTNEEYAKAETAIAVVSDKRGLLMALNGDVKSLINDYLNS